ncbi:MAG TPA: VCBS repeat-containing protein [Pirellulales bacterium]|nr:VCBS repeat-containing protein [Pirellulales bacterium]
MRFWVRASMPAAVAAFLFAAGGLSRAEEKAPAKIRFKRTQFDAKFRSEGAAVGDFNHDGKMDISAGSVYYAAPDWKMHVVADKAEEYDPVHYSNSFCNFADDLNGDGWTDLLVVDFPGQQTWWLENPHGAAGPWKRHVATPVTNNEGPLYLDIDGDGRRELVAGFSPDAKDTDGPLRQMGIIRRGADAYEPWKIQAISVKAAPGTVKYAHGLGVGDVNRDGRNDVLVPEGWWESPAKDDGGPWQFHDAPFGQPCSNMYAYDFDGDGDNDVLSSAAHQIGIWWHEQTADGWKTHEIDRSFSQTHSLCLADINGDGLMDFVTGKRWWAHGPNGDVNPGDPAVMYWFELTRKNGKPVWIPHEFDHDSGVGTQFEVADVNGDGLLDVVTSNKKGVNYFQQVRE